MSETIELAKQLIAKPSITPADHGCQALMVKRLEAIGFKNENLRFADVDNFWARRGNKAPLIVFAGHTDVVPPGPLSKWTSPPFEPTERDQYLYGRGAADMKGSLAAMVTACERFIQQHANHNGSIGFLITSDEEGPSINGTIKVVEHLEARNEKIDACIVGEPSSDNRLGDVIKNGRRGSLGGILTVKGIQGHVAYPHLAKNPILMALPFLNELSSTTWDSGNDHFPPTTFQISNINGGTGATNVIPETVEIVFNFRYSTVVTHDELIDQVETMIKKYDLDYQLDWNLSGRPFITEHGDLIDATKKAIKSVLGIDTQLSTAGGTSDGRFIAPTGAQVVEIGPLNATIHKINECVKAHDLDDLSAIYEDILTRLLVS